MVACAQHPPARTGRIENSRHTRRPAGGGRPLTRERTGHGVSRGFGEGFESFFTEFLRDLVHSLARTRGFALREAKTLRDVHGACAASLQRCAEALDAGRDRVSPPPTVGPKASEVAASRGGCAMDCPALATECPRLVRWSSLQHDLEGILFPVLKATIRILAEEFRVPRPNAVRHASRTVRRYAKRLRIASTQGVVPGLARALGIPPRRVLRAEDR